MNTARRFQDLEIDLNGQSLDQQPFKNRIEQIARKFGSQMKSLKICSRKDFPLQVSEASVMKLLSFMPSLTKLHFRFIVVQADSRTTVEQLRLSNLKKLKIFDCKVTAKFFALIPSNVLEFLTFKFSDKEHLQEFLNRQSNLRKLKMCWVGSLKGWIPSSSTY